MVRGINIVDARTSPCAIEDDANAVGLNLVEAKDALSFGALSHTAASSSHPCDRVSCRWSNIEEKQALKICQVSEKLLEGVS